MTIAITRAVPASIAECELTHLPRVPIDLAEVRAEHAALEAALVELGCKVRRLPERSDLPDSVFVEDTAVVLPELAVVARPGAPSRRGEVADVRDTLRALRPLAEIQPPATLDGGDVLILGRELVVGLSSRTDYAAVQQLQRMTEPFGYRVRALPVRACLHLKSAVTRVAEDALLVNPDWVDTTAFTGWRFIACHPSEPFGANALAIAGAVLYPEHFPRTADRLAMAGLDVRTVPAAELAKAEGGLTCCVLRVA